MAEYTYLTTDLAGNILAELELSGVSYQRTLSAAGDFSGSLIVDTSKDLADINQSTLPGVRGLYVLRDGFPMWGGIIWKRQYDPSNRKVTLTGSTFESYFDHRFQNQTIFYAGTDQLDIARSLIAPIADQINLTISSVESGILRDRTMFDYEFKTRGEELDALAGLIKGFDYNVNIFFGSDGSIQQRLDFGYPQLGLTAAQSGFVFEYPGNISGLQVSEDGESGGNTVFAIGAGEGEDQLNAVASDATSIANGYPILETSRSYTTVLDPSDLQEHADNDLAQLKPPIEIWTLNVVRPDEDPMLGEYSPGDSARFLIDDVWLGKLDFSSRITGFTVTVSDAGGPESISLSFDATERTDDGTTEEDT